VILISNLTLNIKDGSTIASTEIYGADKKTYINIGSGNVFKLDWHYSNTLVDYYKLIIKRYDPTSKLYFDIFDKNIGLVNEFYVDSSMLPIAPEQYLLSVYLVAYDKYGNINTTSNVLSPYISRGSGTYVKVESDKNVTYTQPIMKRALGFVNTAQAMMSTSAITQLKLLDIDGNTLIDINDAVLYSGVAAKLLNRERVQLVDAKGRALFAPATKLLESTNGWAMVQTGYTKDASGNWRANDITYEALVDVNGDIILGEDNKPIYVL
jgi:hypothetical protein